MNFVHQEIEVKVFLPQFEIVQKKLIQLDASLVHDRVFERNVRYDTDSRSLTEQGIVLRLREDDHVHLTYKSGGLIDRGITTREELELEISDFGTMDAILGKLGYTAFMIYEKYRTTYALNGAEIVLDELPYGNFVEVEGSKQQIESTLAALDLATAKRLDSSYARLFDFVKHHLELNFRDLTFENFASINVPESAFIPPGSIVIS